MRKLKRESVMTNFTSLPTKRELKLFFRWISYKLNPPRCSDCDTKIISQHGYFSSSINGKLFGVDITPKKCRDCAEKYVKSLNLRRIECSCCGQRKPGTGYQSHHNSTLTLYWDQVWNGKTHCIDCILYAIRTAKIETNLRYWNRFTEKIENLYF
jgi:hypothetical protein